MAWKKLTVIAVWTLALVAWAGLAGLYFTEPTVKVWAMAVTGAAILTEIAFWITAAVFGLSLWESRRAAWRFLTRPFRGGGRQTE